MSLLNPTDILLPQKTLVRDRWQGAALVLLFVFFVFQAITLDYGTGINDLPHITDYESDLGALSDSALGRDVIAGSGGSESLDRWFMRFKLYSIEADEMLNIIALARMAPEQGDFDPHFYQYGGAWLYPLGAWYGLLSVIGIIERSSLESALRDPSVMDHVYTSGRLFVLFAVVLSAYVLFRMLTLVGAPSAAFLGMVLFLSCPATIMFSQVMKPHWYALLWINISLYFLVKAFVHGRVDKVEEFWIGIGLGMAVGSSLMNGLFSVLVWLAVLIITLQSTGSYVSLVRLPLIAFVVFFASNPYILLSWETYRTGARIASGWFEPAFEPSAWWAFTENSLFSGMGMPLCLLFLYATLSALIAKKDKPACGLAIAIILSVLVMAALLASLGDWHTNLRYIAYILPLGLLLVVQVLGSHGRVLLGAAILLTLVQSAPLKLAYFDENNPQYSTRLQAAHWIDTHVSPGSSLCLNTGTPAPFDAPPIDFTRYDINSLDCRYLVRVERQADSIREPIGRSLKVRFEPRFSSEILPLVFSHINAQISIYQRDE